MIYLFDKNENLFKIVRKSAIKTALQKYALTTERYVSERLTVEMKVLNDDELEKVEYMAIQTMEDAHTFHYFYVAQKSSENLTTLIGVQSGIEELRKSPVFDKRPQNAFAREVIDDLLAGTNWQARFVGETTPHSTNFYYISTFDALKKVCEVWDLEMQFFVEMNGNRIGARYIDFKRKIGRAVGKRVVYGHNALQILQEVERTNIFTALVGRGKGVHVSGTTDSPGTQQENGYGRKITFEDVVWSTAKGKPVNKPKGQKYLELPAMTKLYGIKNADGSMRPKIGFVEFPEEEDPEILTERTYKALVDTARPQLTLKTSSVYLRGVKIGDTIRVVRHDKKLDYDTRIFEITFNRLNDQSSDIKLGDRIGESNEAKAQTIADKVIDNFVANEFSNFVQNLPDYLPSADGFNNNWYGTEDPSKKHPGKVLINDIWYKPDPEYEGHEIMLRWTGEVWEEILRTYDSEALRDRIAEEVAKVNETMEANEAERQKQIDDLLLKAGANKTLAEEAQRLTTETASDLNLVKDTVNSHTRTIIEQGQSISQVVQTAQGLVSRVSVLMDAQNLVYDPTRYSKYIPRNSTSNLQLAAYSLYSGMRISASGLAGDTYSGFRLPLRTSTFAKGEKLSLRAVIGIDALPDSGGQIKFEIKNSGVIIARFWLNPTRTGNNQVFTATTTVDVTTSRIDEYGLDVLINRNGNVNITQISIVRGDQIPSTFVDSTTAQDLAISTQVGQLAGSWAVQNLTSAGTVLNQINLLANGHNRIDGRLTHITGQTLIDNGVIKSAMIDKLDAGKITTGTLDASRARIINLDASSVTSGTFTGLTFRGGRIEALNSAMYINLNNAEMVLAKDASITFTSEKNVLRRSVSGFGNQFLKFETGQFTRNGVTGYKSNKTLIGSNRSGSENAEDGNFAGLRIWNMNPPQGQSAFDQIDVIGDLIVFEDSATSPGRSPWIMQTYNKDGDLAFYPENSGGKRHVLGMSNRRFKAVHTDELWINGVRLKQILKDISNRIGYAGVDNWASKMG
ncbi:phage tail spike protein [Streptococcus minor]|uniref:phage tail spike protein n=1 Tax=Streptococcus minor TaxID=229549 RepID=UPI00163968F2|nr:phage tail spike protein [Streptococcus minor]